MLTAEENRWEQPRFAALEDDTVIFIFTEKYQQKYHKMENAGRKITNQIYSKTRTRYKRQRTSYRNNHIVLHCV